MDKEFVPFTNREKVYCLINGERDYQDAMPQHKDKEQQRNTPIASWILYMEKLIVNAKDEIYRMDEQGALEFIRKATAVGVACMEYNETPPRINPYKKTV